MTKTPQPSRWQRAQAAPAVWVGLACTIVTAMTSAGGLKAIEALRSKTPERIAALELKVEAMRLTNEAGMASIEKAIDRLSYAMWRRGVTTNQVQRVDP